jgi:hypothetical protein
MPQRPIPTLIGLLALTICLPSYVHAREPIFAAAAPVTAPGVHLALIVALLFAVGLFRVGRKDP